MTSPYVPNYLPQAILVTLFCCLPIGIMAILKANEVNSRLQVGDYEGAIIASQNAKKYCWWSFWGGLIFGIIYILASGS